MPNNYNKDEDKLIKVWGERINLKQFFIGLLISIIFLVVALFIIPSSKDTKLIYGLIAVTISFIINVIWIKPKRNIKVQEEQSNDN